MIKKLIASVTLCIALFSIPVEAVDFSYSAYIANQGDKKYKAVKITPEIYNNINRNMSDIMIFDKDNEEVPYFINSFIEKGNTTTKGYKMKLINSFVKDDFFYYDYEVDEKLYEDVTATSIEVKTDKTGFAKQVEILGSYDSTHWEKVQNDTLYNVDGNKKLEIKFSDIKKYTYYRFKIWNNLEKLWFTSVELRYDNTTIDKEYFIDVIYPKFTTEEKDKTTVVKIQGIKNLKLESITLDSNSVFKRSVSFEGSNTKTLYNLVFQDIKYKDTTININSYRSTSDIAELIIYNNDDKPIEVSEIQVKYYADKLIFDGSKTGNFIFRFGNEDVKSPKEYDIASYKGLVLKEGYDILKIEGIIKSAEGDEPKRDYDYKPIFNIVLVGVAVVMAVAILTKLKKK